MSAESPHPLLEAHYAQYIVRMVVLSPEHRAPLEETNRILVLGAISLALPMEMMHDSAITVAEEVSGASRAEAQVCLRLVEKIIGIKPIDMLERIKGPRQVDRPCAPAGKAVRRDLDLVELGMRRPLPVERAVKGMD